MTIPKGYQRIEGSLRRLAHGGRRIGDADPNETMSVTISVRRRPDAEALPDPATMASGPLGRQKFLSRKEFAERFGAAPKDLKLVEDFGRAHGLTVLESSASKRIVTLSGTVGQMSHAFAVKLGRYKSPTETYRGREGHVHMPKKVALVVEGVFGLDNRRMAWRSGSSGGLSLLTPPQVAKLYHFPETRPGRRPRPFRHLLRDLRTTNNGNGQTIGIFEFAGGYDPRDIDAFFNDLGITTPELTHVSVLGKTNSPSEYNGLFNPEWVLDIDVAGSTASGARIVVYMAPWTEQGWVNVIATAVHDSTNNPSVLSLSWGYAEEKESVGFTWTTQAIDRVHAYFSEAAALFGVTVFAATSDWGSSGESPPGALPPPTGFPDGKAHVWYPASDPCVTACGGTTIIDVSDLSFTETTWPRTGGGISNFFDLPSWQEGIGVPPSANDGHIKRGIPDVAAYADPGYELTLNGGKKTYGGTSAVAPLYAGLMALINAHLPNPAGYLNPRLYSYGKSPNLKVFRDIADGVSNAGFNGAPGYTSGPGWDACTGWGSINGNALLNVLLAERLPIHVCAPTFGCPPKKIYVHVCDPLMKILTPGTLVSYPEIQRQIEVVRQDITVLKTQIEQREKRVGQKTKKRAS